MAAPPHLTNPWISPPPFNNNGVGANAFAAGHFPQLNLGQANALEKVLASFSDADKGYPNAEQTNVALALNAAIMHRGSARVGAWAFCLGLINVLKTHTFEFPNDPQLTEDLDCQWTPLAGVGGQAARRTLGGLELPRMRYLYVIHLHKGRTAGTNVYTLTMYDREASSGRMSFHDPGTGDAAQAANRLAEVTVFWNISRSNFAGCPGFGMAPAGPDTFLYQQFVDVACMNRKSPTGVPRVVSTSRRTLFNVLAWCDILIRTAYQAGDISNHGNIPNDFEQACGFYGTGHLYVALFLLLIRNHQAGGVPFTNAHNFNNENAVWLAYGLRASQNDVLRQQIHNAARYFAVPIWPAANPGAPFTWLQALGG
ncbi:hypothetical protein PFICI_05233 [Pestalotiopsis fici W106-1]|uniref:WIF domain-containing protein n=1 Tax=Pestalotiopsis fici (strain W106-1 / CGMCC3.15140) TaxID=1229662 RepID=W3XD69_PESFW|nr:uncharacterized protein PFICI_05233 [Pestalotiopsis fici W106-1]ETS83357.1 hypothetical protein PFICI_05233 [Pestalotiopsis fici W106-1]